MQGDDFELATVFLGNVGGNLDVFFGRAVDEPVFLFHPDPDVEDRRVVTHFFQAVDDNGGINASGNQCGNVHDGKFLWNPSSGPASWQGVRFLAAGWRSGVPFRIPWNLAKVNFIVLPWVFCFPCLTRIQSFFASRGIKL